MQVGARMFLHFILYGSVCAEMWAFHYRWSASESPTLAFSSACSATTAHHPAQHQYNHTQVL